MSTGCFVISLDFELFWGVRDGVSLEAYRARLSGVREAIPAMLALFEQYGIHATWATVGFLFAESKAQIEAVLPSELPTYVDRDLSPYEHLRGIGRDELDDPYHFGASLLSKVAGTAGQEIGTHTFSHFYCLEAGQTSMQFAADLDAAARIGAQFGPVCRSLVFPRNQYNPAYFDVMRRAGVVAYRSNGRHWAYRGSARRLDSLMRRGFRLADTYLPLSGTGARRPVVPPEGEPVDVPASAFLRPFSPATRDLRDAQRRRLELGIARAANVNGLFHLWWHPHNFGTFLDENLRLLEKLLQQVDLLRSAGRMESLSMCEAAAWLRAQ